MPRKTKETSLALSRGLVKSAEQAVLVSVILDESGSMNSCKQETISGFNGYLNALRTQGGNTYFTLLKFNSTKLELAQNGVPIEDARELTELNYRPDASTPLYDAIGRTIAAIAERIESLKTKARVMVTIQTDGEENSSTEYTREQVLKMIKDRQKQGWVFTFLGADIDAYAAGGGLGISRADTYSYTGKDSAAMFNKVAAIHCRTVREWRKK